MNPAFWRLKTAPAAHVEAYLSDVVRTCEAFDDLVVSVIMFGSAATGNYSPGISDVDLLFAVRDDASTEELQRLAASITAAEGRHGVGKQRSARRLEQFAERITANQRAFFICTRSDLLSGQPDRILGISPAQARFVDRVAIPSIVGSGVVIHGEELLEAIPLPPIRRFDVAKSLFGLFSQVLFTAVAYPLLPHATKYAMDALKRSVHNCYFCYEGRAAPLQEEVDYLDRVQGRGRARARLMDLRREYAPSFGFVITTLLAMPRQHALTARQARFPRDVRREAAGPRQ